MISYLFDITYCFAFYYISMYIFFNGMLYKIWALIYYIIPFAWYFIIYLFDHPINIIFIFFLTFYLHIRRFIQLFYLFIFYSQFESCMLFSFRIHSLFIQISTLGFSTGILIIQVKKSRVEIYINNEWILKENNIQDVNWL